MNVTPASGVTAQIFKRSNTGGLTRIENGSVIDPYNDDLLIRCTKGDQLCEYAVTILMADPQGTPKD